MQKEGISIPHVYGIPWEPFGLFTYVEIYLSLFYFSKECVKEGVFLLLLCSPMIEALMSTYHSFGEEETELRSLE